MEAIERLKVMNKERIRSISKSYGYVHTQIHALLEHLGIELKYHYKGKEQKKIITDQVVSFREKFPNKFNSFITKDKFDIHSFDLLLSYALDKSVRYNRELNKKYRRYFYKAKDRGEDGILSIEEYDKKLKVIHIKAKETKRIKRRRSAELANIKTVNKITYKRDVRRKDRKKDDFAEFEMSEAIFLKNNVIVGTPKKINKKYKKKVKKSVNFGKKWYSELLKHPSWQKKRKLILKRDGYKCTECSSNKLLQVHHIKYISGRKPWEYPNKLLITLCKECHEKKHDLITKK